MPSRHKVIHDELLAVHGVVVAGDELIKLLGFPSSGAFRQAKSRGTLGVRVFTLPGRRGNFALTTDIAAWLATSLEAHDQA